MAFISEIDYLGGGETVSQEFLEITLLPGRDPADFTVSFYDSDGRLTTPEVSSFLSSPEVTLQELIDMVGGSVPGSAPSTVGGRDLQVRIHPDDPDAIVFIIPSDLSDANPPNDEPLNAEAVTLTNTSTGQVLDAYDIGVNSNPVPTLLEGAAAGATPVQTISAVSGGSVQIDKAGNQSAPASKTPGSSVLCFAADTLVMTSGGPRRAAEIAPGDPVCTKDSGALEIVWTKSQTVLRRDLQANPKLCPVRIAAGALGGGLPARDLLVSRQHRMLLASELVEQICGEREVLIPAVKLTGLDGVHVDCDLARISYVHFMFERHQIVFAEGAPSESFLPGPQGLSTLSERQLREFRRLFPAHAAPGIRAEPARRIVDGSEAKRLVSALAESHAPLTSGPGVLTERAAPPPVTQASRAALR